MTTRMVVCRVAMAGLCLLRACLDVVRSCAVASCFASCQLPVPTLQYSQFPGKIPGDRAFLRVTRDLCEAHMESTLVFSGPFVLWSVSPHEVLLAAAALCIACAAAGPFLISGSTCGAEKLLIAAHSGSPLEALAAALCPTRARIPPFRLCNSLAAFLAHSASAHRRT